MSNECLLEKSVKADSELSLSQVVVDKMVLLELLITDIKKTEQQKLLELEDLKFITTSVGDILRLIDELDILIGIANSEENVLGDKTKFRDIIYTRKHFGHGIETTTDPTSETCNLQVDSIYSVHTKLQKRISDIENPTGEHESVDVFHRLMPTPRLKNKQIGFANTDGQIHPANEKFAENFSEIKSSVINKKSLLNNQESAVLSKCSSKINIQDDNIAICNTVYDCLFELEASMHRTLYYIENDLYAKMNTVIAIVNKNHDLQITMQPVFHQIINFVEMLEKQNLIIYNTELEVIGKALLKQLIFILFNELDYIFCKKMEQYNLRSKVITQWVWLPKLPVKLEIDLYKGIKDRRLKRIENVCHCKIRIIPDEEAKKMCDKERTDCHLVQVCYNKTYGNHTGSMYMLRQLFADLRFTTNMLWVMRIFKTCYLRSDGYTYYIYDAAYAHKSIFRHPKPTNAKKIKKFFLSMKNKSSPFATRTRSISWNTLSKYVSHWCDLRVNSDEELRPVSSLGFVQKVKPFHDESNESNKVLYSKVTF